MLGQMSFEEFQAAVASGGALPPGLGPPLQALAHEARGEWEAAHRAVQDDPSREAAWVHGYLHRSEGDDGNAGYWYARARQPMPDRTVSAKTEWAAVARALLPAPRPPAGA